jgi:hypothetical protein
LVLLSTPALLAVETTIKTCNTSVPSVDVPNTVVEMSIVITANDLGELKAEITKTTPDKVENVTQQVVLSEGAVRADLTMESDATNLNAAEQMVSHAMMLTEDPSFMGIYSTGFDLHQVRSAKVYLLGAAAKFGRPALVEARDANNNLLGTYLGGFLISPCK